MISPTTDPTAKSWANQEWQYLNYVSFKNFFTWGVKHLLQKELNSRYAFDFLGNHIQTERQKIKPFLQPDKDFGILGVNNKEGLFDAYMEKGAKINQPYQVVKKDWLAYNPYRVNVGSVGLKTEKHQFELISNAYVVFSCLPTLLPHFLYTLFQTNIFNAIIRENTSGSVRENLTFDLLSKIKIPILPLSEQENLVADYEKYQKAVEKLLQEVADLEKRIEEFFNEMLGIELVDKKEIKKGLQCVSFKDLSRWDIDYLVGNPNDIFAILKRAKYPLRKIGDVYQFVTRSWNKRQHEGNTFNYVEIGSVDEHKGITESTVLEVENAPSRATQIIKTDDLILGLTRPYLKKFALVQEKYNDDVCSSGFQVLAPSTDYDLFFLNEYLKSFSGIQQFEYFMSGALYPAINTQQLRELLIPFPPLSLQQTITTEIRQIRITIQQKKELITEYQQKAMNDFENSIF